MQRVNGGGIDVRAPKYGSERVVYLADSFVTVLAEHVAVYGTTGKERWLFAGEATTRRTRTPSATGGARRCATPVCRTSSHDLRHFDASGLIAAGCDVVTAQQSLGHAKATTTINTYALLWPIAEDPTRKAAESMMSASLGPPTATPAELATWPAEPVRDMLEAIGSRELKNGLVIGRLNSRGVTSRGVYDGGDQERTLTAKYRSGSNSTKATGLAPRASSAR